MLRGTVPAIAGTPLARVVCDVGGAGLCREAHGGPTRHRCPVSGVPKFVDLAVVLLEDVLATCRRVLSAGPSVQQCTHR